MIHVITSTGISILHKLVKLQIAECWWQIHNIIKIEQKPYRHTYIQAHSADIQLVSGIAVLHPQFGDVATSIQSTYMVSSGHWICTEEEAPRQIKTVKQYSALQSPFFTQDCGVCCYCNIIECMYAYAELCNYRFLYWCACMYIESEWVFLHPKEWLCLWARSICIIA